MITQNGEVMRTTQLSYVKDELTNKKLTVPLQMYLLLPIKYAETGFLMIFLD